MPSLFLGDLIPKGEKFGSKQGKNEYHPKGGTTLIPKGEKQRGNDGFRWRPSQHWMMISIQASVSGFNWLNFLILAKFMFALIVLSSITKKGETIRKMAPLGHCFVILVIE